MADAPKATALPIEAATDGLKVRTRDGESLGTVKTLMLDKRTGQATYAVLSLSGFLGMGKSYYPVPFGLLAYDPSDDCHIVTIDRRVLEGGPSWANHAPEFNQAYADRVSSYYSMAPTSAS